jgi:L-threonylcarbamoyladenylate synthase
METSILVINAQSPEPQLLEQAAGVLRRGGVVAAPTDTVYGLLADPANEAAVQSIYQIKGREPRRPLILLVSNIQMAKRLFSEISPLAQKAMQHFWPGGLTIILPAPPAIPKALLGGGNTIGLRWPNHAVVMGLIEKAGFPLASTSANLSGQPPAREASVVLQSLEGEIDLLIDAGPAPLGGPSSVLDFSAGESPRLLRPGSISRGQLEAVLGTIQED